MSAVDHNKKSSSSSLAASTRKNHRPFESGIAFREKQGRAHHEEVAEKNLHLNQRTGLGLVACKVLYNPRFDPAICTIICLNVCVMIMEANHTAGCVFDGTEHCEQQQWIEYANLLFLLTYTTELLFRVIVEQKAFIRKEWNWLDLTVVITGWMEEIGRLVAYGIGIPGLSHLRVFRLMRLMRAVRLLKSLPSLTVMVSGFVGVMQAMAWGLCLIMLMLLLISIFAVNLVGPVQKNLDSDNEWCNEAFSSVYSAWLFFFQITVMGDSWGACSIPLIQEHFYLFILFGGCFFVVELGLMNLILSSIIDSASESHEHDLQMRCVEVEREKEDAINQLKEIFKEIDRDGSNTICKDEMMKAYDSHASVAAIFTLHDIDREEVELFYDLMDKDKDEKVEISEFTKCMSRAMQQDVRMQMMGIRLQMTDVQQTVTNVLKAAIEELRQQMELKMERLAERQEAALSRLGSQSRQVNQASGDEALARERSSKRGAAARAAVDLEKARSEEDQRQLNELREKAANAEARREELELRVQEERRDWNAVMEQLKQQGRATSEPPGADKQAAARQRPPPRQQPSDPRAVQASRLRRAASPAAGAEGAAAQAPPSQAMPPPPPRGSLHNADLVGSAPSGLAASARQRNQPTPTAMGSTPQGGDGTWHAPSVGMPPPSYGHPGAWPGAAVPPMAAPQVALSSSIPPGPAAPANFMAHPFPQARHPGYRQGIPWAAQLPPHF